MERAQDRHGGVHHMMRRSTLQPDRRGAEITRANVLVGGALQDAVGDTGGAGDGADAVALSPAAASPGLVSRGSVRG